ncbi:MAG: family 43 glycosylhydrolase, partial [Muribaculaceae bacterium]|nr:family 43 glycosylhydrolase [Muribaculaceae bacterium]
MAALCGLFAQAAADAPRDTTEGSINAPLRDTDLISLPLEFKNLGNPLIRHRHTADPAVMVTGDTLWLYTGADQPGNRPGYNMHNWCVFSTTDMQNWTEHPFPIRIADFKWDRNHAAYAAHGVEYEGKYYFVASTNGSGIGVAVSDSPKGPFKDLLGKALITASDCEGASHSWVCIDPAVFIDDDGTPYLFWGNRYCYYAPLSHDFTSLAGPIRRLDELKDFTEAPWVHKRNGLYYLTYAAQWPEKIAYAISESIDGPWDYQGIISETAGNSNTTHPAIAEFKGKTYFFSHTGGIY